MQRRLLSILLLTLASWASCSITLVAAGLPTKDLYYFVIDRSGSIGEKKLVEPFSKAVVDFVGRLDPETQVEIVFFSDSATRPRTWYPMDLKAKGEFGKYFEDNFRPSGQTLLYATLADVLSRVLAKEKEFRNVSIVILSDGEDNQSAPKYTSLDDVERLLPEKWAKERKGLKITWAAVGFTPADKDRPAKDSIVRILPNLNKDDIDQVFTPPPRATFTANPSKVKVGEPVLFALYDDTSVTSVKWTFGDGTESTKKTVSHQYTTKGSYDVSVEATGLGGKARADIKGYVQVVEEVPPEAHFSWYPMLIRIGEDVKFADESLGVPTVWKWEFEGLGSRNERNPTVVFSKAGKAKVSLSVAKEGASHSIQQELDVLPLPPDATFTAEPSELEMGQILHLKATTNESEWTHSWVIGGDSAKEGPEANWTANKLGRVEVQHAVQGAGGLVEKTFTVFVSKEPAPLVARFDWSPKEIHVSVPIKFVDDSKGAPNKWRWEITGVPPITEHNPKVTFADAGKISVKLSIERDGRKAESGITEIDVLPKETSLQSRFDVDLGKGKVPLTVQFADKSKGEISGWRWDFGDGTSSDIQNPRHTYDQARSYTPRLTIKNSKGEEAKDRGDTVIVVKPPPPPPPWWITPLIVLIAACLLWVLFVVPFILKPLIAPQKGVMFRGSTVWNLRQMAGKYHSNILWPRGHVTIGTRKEDDIRIGGVGQKAEFIAVVKRLLASSSYQITVLAPNAVSKEKAVGGVDLLPPKKVILLRPDDKFDIRQQSLTWVQPSAAKTK